MSVTAPILSKELHHVLLAADLMTAVCFAKPLPMPVPQDPSLKVFELDGSDALLLSANYTFQDEPLDRDSPSSISKFAQGGTEK